MLSRANSIYQEFPRTFWILTGATFIDQVGGWLLFPFFALYVTDHFGVGMTEVGILFAIFSVANFVGSFNRSPFGRPYHGQFESRSCMVPVQVGSARSRIRICVPADPQHKAHWRRG